MKIILRNIEDKNYQGTIKEYISKGGYKALKKALAQKPEKIIEEIKRSGLRGRGGAAFPTGIKWEAVYKAERFPKIIVANADEGEPGTFKDKVILERDPHLLLEAMIIAAFATGASEGFIYLRGEYFKAYQCLAAAIEEARKERFLGKNILGKEFNFSLLVYCGAGSYECGEETALLESLEGKKGRARLKPPFPTQAGFKNKPTLVNNVETFALVPAIILKGADWFRGIGARESCGTKLYCVSGDVKAPGVYELPMNVSLRELVYKYAQGVEGNLKAVIVGGPSGCFWGESDLDIRMDYKSIEARGGILGSGAVVVLNDKRCIVDAVMNCVNFFRHESCGACVPCREGTKNAWYLMQQIKEKKATPYFFSLVSDLFEVMRDTSRCGLGQVALNSLVSAIEMFPREFKEHIEKKKCRCNICF